MRNGFLHLQNQPVKFRDSFLKTSTYWVLPTIFNGYWIECVLLGTILNGDWIKWWVYFKNIQHFLKWTKSIFYIKKNKYLENTKYCMIFFQQESMVGKGLIGSSKYLKTTLA